MATAPPRSASEPAHAQAQIQFRLPHALRGRLYKEAARRGVSVNFLIERSLVESLDKWEKQKLV